MYTGKAKAILESRKRKLQLAKEQRIRQNLKRIENQKQINHKNAA